MEITANGARNDRLLCLLGEDGKFISQRTDPRMALVQTNIFTGNDVVISVPENEGANNLRRLEFHLPDTRHNRTHTVLFHDNEPVQGIDVGDEAADWFTAYLGKKCRLLRMGSVNRFMESGGATLNFQDGNGVSILSTGSVEELNDRLEKDLVVPPSQFRMNIIVGEDGGETEPHIEDRFRRVRIGKVQLEFKKLTPRCVMVNVNQETGRSNPDVLATLASYRTFRHHGKNKVFFGSYFVHHLHGFVSVGDRVEVVRWGDPPTSEPN